MEPPRKFFGKAIRVCRTVVLAGQASFIHERYKAKRGLSRKAAGESLLCPQMLPVQIQACAVVTFGRFPRKEQRKHKLTSVGLCHSGEHKIHFIPGMIGPFLGVTLVPQPEVRNIMIPIFHDMMDWEQRKNGNFKQVRHPLAAFRVFSGMNPYCPGR